jgi:replicative DNA helicase
MEFSLLCAILQYQLIDPVLEAGITVDDFKEPNKRYFKWILEFYEKYKQVPSKDAFEKEFNVKVEFVYDPLAYFVDKFRNNVLAERYYRGIKRVADMLVSAKNGDSIKEVGLSIAQLGQEVAKGLVRQQDSGLVVQVLKNMIKQEVKPILDLPWPSLASVIGGIRIGEFWVIAGRPNVGKTYIALYLLSQWIRQGCQYEVMFISPEMSREVIIERLLAIHYKFNINSLKARTDEAKTFIQDKINEWNTIPLRIYDNVSDVRQLNVLIAGYKPKLVMIDSVYLMRDSSLDSGRMQLWEGVARVLSELRNIVMNHGIGLVTTTQLSRNVDETNMTMTLSDVAYTDVFSQLADYIIGIGATQELKDQGLRQLKIMKSRHSSTLTLNINFKFMPKIDFSEVGYRQPVNLSNEQEINDVLEF